MSIADFDFFGRFIKKLASSAFPDQIATQKIVLTLLSYPIGCYILCGVRTSAFYDLTILERELAVLNWSTSLLHQLRGLFKVMHLLTLNTIFSNFSADPVLSRAIGESPDEAQNQETGYAHDPSFIGDFSPEYTSKAKVILGYDAVVIGSGCGGSLVAAELAIAGYKVLILEKGEYFEKTAVSTMTEAQSMDNLYERSGAVLSEDFGIGTFAGSSIGGGSIVNWSASLRLPYSVREEWASRFGLGIFTSKKYQSILDTVTSRIGVSTAGIVHNPANNILIEGCEKLGMHVDDIPQNTNGHSHECGTCTWGCPSGIKQSSPQTWLKDAQNHGAKIIKNCYARKVIHKDGKVIGVTATVGKTSDPNTQRRLFIKAKTVVVSCGSINSPALLLRSGLTNTNIGRNLWLHPVSLIGGTFNRDISQGKGSIMTAISNVVKERRDGYGAILEVPAFTPGLAVMLLPWRGRVLSKSLLSTLNNQALFIVLTRDYDSTGTVTIDKDGVSYALSRHDEASIIAGMEAGAKVLVAAGATQIQSGQTAVAPIDIDTSSDNPYDTEGFRRFITSVKKAGIQLNRAMLASAHQMGSCRMTDSPRTGVCKPSGETWEIEGLWVADASLFPTASGVNPMVTTYSIAMIVALEIVKRMGQQVCSKI